jgi:hypothetical protein
LDPELGTQSDTVRTETMATSSAGANMNGGGGGGEAGGQAAVPEESIEFLQREIELLKKRIVDERQKLYDKAIVQVRLEQGDRMSWYYYFYTPYDNVSPNNVLD